MEGHWFGLFLGYQERRSGGAGGGKPRIEFGATGPRGRQYSVSRTPYLRTAPVVKGKFFASGRVGAAVIRDMVRYASKDKDERQGDELRGKTFFARDREGIDPAQVESVLTANQGSRIGLHSMIISPGANDVDIVDYTRDQMQALERQLGHPVLWFGDVHRDTDHHHTHVLIAGQIPSGSQILAQAQSRVELEKAKQIKVEPTKDDHDKKEFLKTTSISQSNMDRAMGRYDKTIEEAKKQDRFNSKGDVYLGRSAYRAMRIAGSRYLKAHLSPERSLDAAAKLELEPDRDRAIDPERTQETKAMDSANVQEPEHSPDDQKPSLETFRSAGEENALEDSSSQAANLFSAPEDKKNKRDDDNEREHVERTR